MSGRPCPSSRTWADIPQELLEEIASRMFLIEQIRCPAVCKNWNRLRKDVSGAGRSLPYVLLCKLSDTRNPVCKLYDPLYWTYPVHLEKLCRRGVQLEYLGSKNWWVVFGQSRKSQLAAYNLFNHEVVKLPKLVKSSDYVVEVTLSSTPNPSDCLFLAMREVHYRYGQANFGNRMCRVGDEAWSTVRLDNGSHFTPMHMIYLDGKLYTPLWSWVFWSFDTLEWRKLKNMTSLLKILVDHLSILVERNGELLCVYDSDGANEWNAARFDFSQMDWVKEADGLEDVAVFPSKTWTFG